MTTAAEMVEPTMMMVEKNVGEKIEKNVIS